MARKQITHRLLGHEILAEAGENLREENFLKELERIRSYRDAYWTPQERKVLELHAKQLCATYDRDSLSKLLASLAYHAVVLDECTHRLLRMVDEAVSNPLPRSKTKILSEAKRIQALRRHVNNPVKDAVKMRYDDWSAGSVAYKSVDRFAEATLDAFDAYNKEHGKKLKCSEGTIKRWVTSWGGPPKRRSRR